MNNPNTYKFKNIRKYVYPDYKFFGQFHPSKQHLKVMRYEYLAYYLREILPFENYAETYILNFMETFKHYRAMTKRRLEAGAQLLLAAVEM